MSFAKCAQLLGRLGINVTAGALCAASAKSGTDLVPTHQAIKAHLSAAASLTMDETGWRIGGEPAWLWVATIDDATL